MLHGAAADSLIYYDHRFIFSLAENGSPPSILAAAAARAAFGIHILFMVPKARTENFLCSRLLYCYQGGHCKCFPVASPSSFLSSSNNLATSAGTHRIYQRAKGFRFLASLVGHQKLFRAMYHQNGHVFPPSVISDCATRHG
jgi:hypothetical protein